MNKQFEIIRNTRKFLLGLVSELTIDDLNTVPPGFNNNIIWNLAHLVAAQQNVCYARTGLPIRVPEDFFQSYKPETRPVLVLDQAQIEEVKQLFTTTIDQLEEDYHNNLFSGYKAWTNRYGVTHNNIEDTIISSTGRQALF